MLTMNRAFTELIAAIYYILLCGLVDTQCIYFSKHSVDNRHMHPLYALRSIFINFHAFIFFFLTEQVFLTV